VKESSSYIQDTIKLKVFAGADSLKQITDSALINANRIPDTNVVPAAGFIRHVNLPADTDSVSGNKINPGAYLYLYDTAIFTSRRDNNLPYMFPYSFIGGIKDAKNEKMSLLYKSLHQGQEIGKDEYHIDWVVPVLLFAVLILGIIRSISSNFLKGILKFITLQGTGETSIRESSDLYRLPSTLFNLASFLTISLFSYLLTIQYHVSIPGFSGFAIWSLCLGTIIAAVTMRHIICILAGNWSSQQEAFTEYLKIIYEGYRLAGLFYIFIVVFILYTPFLPDKFLFNAGIYGAGIIYLMRISRLMLIFINRHISLFYFILYLCALEILPVVVLVKYVTGLV